jgi:hypothetical protein
MADRDPQGAQGDDHSQSFTQLGKRQVGFLSEQFAKPLIMGGQDRNATIARRPRSDLAELPPTLLDATDPCGTDPIFASDLVREHAGIAIRQHPFAQIHRQRSHRTPP